MIPYFIANCKSFFNIFQKFFRHKNAPEASSIKASGDFMFGFYTLSHIVGSAQKPHPYIVVYDD